MLTLVQLMRAVQSGTPENAAFKAGTAQFAPPPPGYSFKVDATKIDTPADLANPQNYLGYVKDRPRHDRGVFNDIFFGYALPAGLIFASGYGADTLLTPAGALTAVDAAETALIGLEGEGFRATPLRLCNGAGRTTFSFAPVRKWEQPGEQRGNISRRKAQLRPERIA